MWMVWLLYGACLLAGLLVLRDVVTAKPLAWAFVVPHVAPLPAPASQDAPRFEVIFDRRQPGRCCHAAAFGGAGLLWFEGSREAGEDVKIRQANLATRQISDWFDTRALTNALSPRQTVRVLGNTIGVPPKGTNPKSPGDTSGGGFIATTVSIGGWAGSSLVLGCQTDEGLRAKRLYTHAYFNRSHLVRSPLVPLVGGDWLLPAYFEARLCMGEMIRLAPDGTARWKARIGQGRQLIQPCIHILDAKRAFALCRSADSTRRLYRSETNDGGKRWSRPHMTDLPCPHAPIALAPLSGGRVLMAHSPTTKHSERLRLSISDDEGRTWRKAYEFASGEAGLPEGSLRYPALKADGVGGLILAFTAQSKQAVMALAFNETWLATQG